jgi:hypothetical protein
MSRKQVEINSAVHTIVSFIKQTVSNNLVEGSNTGKINIGEEELKKISFLISESIDQGFVRAFGELESVTKDLK